MSRYVHAAKTGETWVSLCSLPSEGLMCVLTSTTPDEFYIRDSAGFDHQLSKEQAQKIYRETPNKHDLGSPYSWA